VSAPDAGSEVVMTGEFSFGPSGRLVAIAVLALFGIVFAADTGNATPARHETPRHYCARVGTDDTLRKPPRSLGADIRRMFGIDGKYALQASYWRCAGSDVLVCTIGANLPCGKADTTTRMPAASKWCGTHANSDFIPMVVTGHDTIYAWRCVGRTAKPGAQTGHVDARGFFADNWKKL
jgi:hypothetical protein